MTNEPTLPITLADPIFTLSGNPESASLFDLFSLISTDKSFELPCMAAHQRVPVATALALLMTTLKRYTLNPPTTTDQWSDAWSEQIGSDALRIVSADTEVAFLQPPLEATGFRSPMSLSDIDLTFTKLAHAVKPVDTGSAEEAVLALMGGTWKSSALKWVGGSRYGLAAVLASDDGSFAGEVRHLVRAYEAFPSASMGRNAKGTSAADHLLWLRPVNQSGLDSDRIPWPYQEARPCHLVMVDVGVYGGVGQHSAPRRLAGDIHADDPHVALIKGAPYRLSDKRPWNLSTLHEMLFGSERTTRPAALGVSGYKSVRVCAVTTRQATTLGYREAFFPLAQSTAFSLFSEPHRAADLSSRGLDTASLVSRKLAYAARMLVAGGDKSAAVSAIRLTTKTQYLSEVRDPLTLTVLALLEAPEDPVNEQSTLSATCAETARVLWQRIITGCHEPLSVAAATAYLRYHLNTLTGETSMAETPALARQCHAILREIANHLTPEQRAKLRTMVPNKPAMAYYTGLSAVPEAVRAAPVWSVVIPAMGRMQVKGRNPGRALADSGYPEMRMQRLLGATGEALVAQTSTACNWLVSREEVDVDLGLLAAMGVADWENDREALEVLRTHLAMGFVTRARKSMAA